MNIKAENILHRIWGISKWLLLVLYLFITLGMVNAKKQTLPCRAIETQIIDSLSVHFITEKEMTDMILNRYGKILGSPISRVVSGKIEKLISQNPFVARAEVYKDIEGVLHLRILQRHPVARIIRNSKPDVYLDRDGILLKSNQGKPVYVLVVSGYTRLRNNMLNKPVTSLPGNHPLQGVYRIAAFIDSTDFWKNQIEQIYINRDGEFWLTPRAGAHRIQFGNADNYKWKFRKLYLLYTYGLNNIGWNQYETINLKYSNQVVCEKRK